MIKFKFKSKKLLTNIFIYTTTLSIIHPLTANSSSQVNNNAYISPYVTPYTENTQINQRFTNRYKNYYWSDYFAPANVWWAPYEFDDSNMDVIEALVNPFFIQNNSMFYKIEVGTNRLAVNQKQINLLKAVGKIVYSEDTGAVWNCTATHVGNNYVVTAGHCLPDPKITPNVCDNIKIQWGYRKHRDDMEAVPTADSIGQCVKIISWEFNVGDPNTMDHAILQVDQAPMEAVEIESKPELNIGDNLYQFSHPGGQPLIWSKDCKLTKIPYQYLQHDCWGASGSSGSALIDATTFKLVGILSMGQDRTFFSTRNDLSPVGCFDITTGVVKPNCQ